MFCFACNKARSINFSFISILPDMQKNKDFILLCEMWRLRNNCREACKKGTSICRLVFLYRAHAVRNNKKTQENHICAFKKNNLFHVSIFCTSFGKWWGTIIYKKRICLVLQGCCLPVDVTTGQSKLHLPTALNTKFG